MWRNLWAWTLSTPDRRPKRSSKSRIPDAVIGAPIRMWPVECTDHNSRPGGFRDVAELLLQRGYEVSYETIRIWEFRFAPLVSENLRVKRRGVAGHSWYLDETYIKVSGRWRYLYRAIDREGNLLDSMLSEHRDKHAARRFLRRLIDSAGRKPLRMTTDKHPAYTKAIRWIVGRKVLHRHNQYLNNRIEQNHRGIKQRYYPMLGFKQFE